MRYQPGNAECMGNKGKYKKKNDNFRNYACSQQSLLESSLGIAGGQPSKARADIDETSGSPQLAETRTVSQTPPAISFNGCPKIILMQYEQ